MDNMEGRLITGNLFNRCDVNEDVFFLFSFTIFPDEEKDEDWPTATSIQTQPLSNNDINSESSKRDYVNGNDDDNKNDKNLFCNSYNGK